MFTLYKSLKAFTYPSLCIRSHLMTINVLWPLTSSKSSDNVTTHFLLFLHTIIHLRVVAEINLSLSFKSLLVLKVSPLIWDFLLLGQFIVHLCCYSNQIRCTKCWVLSFNLRHYILNENIISAFGFFGSIFILKPSL
jgi:hypothetical protein